MKADLDGTVIVRADIHEHGVTDGWDQGPKAGLKEGTYRLPAKPGQRALLLLTVCCTHSI